MKQTQGIQSLIKVVALKSDGVINQVTAFSESTPVVHMQILFLN